MPYLPGRFINLALQLRVKNWQSYIPIVPTLARYRRDDLSHDIVAGIVLGVITVPQAIAYAFLAGLPAEAGLYASLVPMVIYAVFGSSKHLVVGPVAITALMVAAAVGEYAPRYDQSYLGVTTVLCLQAGIFLWLLRLSQMGGLVNLLSHPVITGFVNAAALLIIISQLPALTGIGPGDALDPYHQLLNLARRVDELNPAVVAVGIGCLLGLWLVRRYSVALLRLLRADVEDDHPVRRTGPMVVAALAAVVVAVWNLDAELGVAVVGQIPSGLPELTRPPFHWQLWTDVAPVSAMIAVVSYVESYSIGTTLATRERTRVNSHQELIALGAANIGAAFSGAYPVAGSFSRSSVNYQTGARTQVSALVCMVVIVLTLLFFTPLFARLPHAALAAIVMASVVGIVDLMSMRRHWRIHKEDSLTEFATLATVLAFGVETGLITGVALSIAFFIRTSSRPHIAIVGRIPHTEHFRSARRYDVETFPHVAAIRIDENVYFGNANQVESKLLKIIQRRPGTRHVLLVMSAVNLVDVSGLEMLYRLNDNLAAMGIKLHLSEVKGPVMEHFEATDFTMRLTGSVFFTTDQAMRDLAERT
ncbi:MAG: sodium-independent anion transporter [Gammaproteobacteria bacterium]|nr:sodium-independent anion transporter [Gammaproteobacteria bacterium]MBK80418.1 sodium-independent anion transporter [Gammaproteobacteria bacterium]|tara:strand:+ start:7852 stop:9621 length:1770 start_codon:yes stop_codon:yes gene_type:complete